MCMQPVLSHHTARGANLRALAPLVVQASRLPVQPRTAAPQLIPRMPLVAAWPCQSPAVARSASAIANDAILPSGSLGEAARQRKIRRTSFEPNLNPEP